MENEEELIRRVEDAAREGAKHGSAGSTRNSILFRIVPIIIAIAFVIGGAWYIKYSITNGWRKFAQEFVKQFDVLDPASSHDMVLDNNGIFGYTAADFAEAILGDTKQLKKIEVYQAKISDAVTVTDAGFAKLAIFSKTQVITYNGIATYTVDLSGLSEDDIEFDETHKTIVLRIPHAELEPINIPSNQMEFSDPEKGWLAFGDISITPEQSAQLQTKASEKMETKLEELNEQANADKFATLTVWEIYQPIVSSVAPSYKLEVKFRN